MRLRLLLPRPSTGARREHGCEEICAVLDDVRDRGDVGAVVFTGAGGGAFLAGADVGQVVDRTVRDGLATGSRAPGASGVASPA